MLLPEAFDQYLIACQTNGLSPNSTRWYLSVLRPFVLTYQTKPIAEVTTHEIRLYIHNLMNRQTRYEGASQRPVVQGGLSRDSIAGHVRALHAFWGWASEEYEIANPMSRIKRHKNHPVVPKAIEQADFLKLFNATGDDHAGARDRALLCFLADTGCRVGGALSLDVRGLNLAGRRAFVTEKGNAARLLVFTHFTAQILNAWLAKHPQKSSAVFCSIRTGERLTSSGISQIMQRLKAKAGVKGRVNPHSFRHGFAREYLKNGGDLVTLSRLLGHKDISTTAMYYAIFSRDELAAMHEQFSPISDELLINWL